MTKHHIKPEQFLNIAHIDMSKPIGEQLKTLRLKMGVNASTICKITGDNNRFITTLENGEIEQPKIHRIMAYLTAAGYGSIAITNSETEPYADKVTRKAIKKVQRPVIQGDFAVFKYKNKEQKVRISRVSVVLPDNFAELVGYEANTYRLTYTPVNGIVLNNKGLKVGAWTIVKMKQTPYLQIVCKAWMQYLARNTDRIPWARDKQKVKAQLKANLQKHKEEFNLDLKKRYGH